MKKNNKGFTLIELMVATLAFSIVLLIATTTAIHIGRSYYKGLVQSKTQEAVRNISEEVTRTIQFANGDLRKVDPAQPNDPKKQFCIGDTRYTYQLNKKVEGTSASNDYGLKIDRINSGDTCKSDPSGREFLQTNMRLLDFRVTPDASNKIFTVTIKVAYGDDDLLTHYDDNGNPINNSQPKDANCKSGIAGSNFCATSLLDNPVKRRLN
jgi:prepilin-type N-terminal cleavage/methylation domain-containing protein